MTQVKNQGKIRHDNKVQCNGKRDGDKRGMTNRPTGHGGCHNSCQEERWANMKELEESVARVVGRAPGSCTRTTKGPYLHAPHDLAWVASSQSEFCNKM